MATFCSPTKVLMPRLHYLSCIIRHDPPNVHEFRPAESTTSRKADRLDPKLCQSILALYVNVQWLIAVTGIEEESVWPVLKDCRHGLRVENTANSGKRIYCVSPTSHPRP